MNTNTYYDIIIVIQEYNKKPYKDIDDLYNLIRKLYCIVGIEITFIREIIENTITRDQQHKDELVHANKNLIILEKKKEWAQLEL